MKLFRVTSFFLSFILGIGLMTGCVNKDKLEESMDNGTTIQSNGSADNTESVVKDVPVQLQGSVNVLPLMLGLTEGKSFDVNAVGKASSIEAVQAETADLAMFDGSLEEAAGNAEIIGYAGIAFIVNTSSTLESLTYDDIVYYYTGELEEIQGQTMTMVLTDTSVPSRALFEEFFPIRGDVNGMQKSLIPNTATIVESDDAVIQEVMNNQNAIGIVMAGKVSSQIKALKVDGIEASQESIASGSYMASKSIVLMANDSEAELLNSFIEITKSEQGKEIITNLGYIPQ